MKLLKILSLFLIFLVILVAVVNFYFTINPLTSANIKFGLSYSPKYAKSLNLDPKQTYQQILKDLRVKNIRLIVYWDELEAEKDRFNFTDLDFYLDEAKKVGAALYLTVGYKVPRWPECSAPSWLNQHDIKFRQERQLNMLKQVILRYDAHQEVLAWQIENEPLVSFFGICPPPDRNFLHRQIKFIKSQTQKPIILTDSGELRSWVTPMKLSDIFGSTLYRKVHNPIFGYINYPIPPWHYFVKSSLVRTLFAPQNQKTIVAELQAEVWLSKDVKEVSVSDQAKNFSIKDFKDNIEFAKRTGFDQFFLWGTEWWYFMAKNGHPEYLEYARSLF